MLHYVSDNSGQTTAVIIQIEEWNISRNKYPEVDNIDGELPQWEKILLTKIYWKYLTIPKGYSN